MILLELLLLFLAKAQAEPLKKIRLFPGFVTKVKCEGRLLVSASGDDRIAKLEPLPKDLGCGVVLKPLVKQGETNLILETSSGPHNVLVQVISGKPKSTHDLTIRLNEEKE